MPRVGIDAPTTARTAGLPPRGGKYFLSARKKVPKKARGTATPGKSPLLPIFERGSSQCRAQTNWRANSCYRARSCSLFSSFKKGKAFSLRCLSPLCSAAVGAGQTQIALLGVLRCGWAISRRKRPMEFPNYVGLWCKPEGLSPDGGLYQPTSGKQRQTGEPWHPS